MTAVPSTSPSPVRRPHVVVVGGGFAGVTVVRRLRRADVDVTLIDRRPSHTFPPLLYQVATAGLNAGDISWFLRAEQARNPRLRFLLGAVHGVDTTARRLRLTDGRRVDYDHLVLATGVEVDFLDVPGAPEHALPLYSRAGALALRDRLVHGLEVLARDSSDRDVRVVVVGGGATGVEMAGALAELRLRDLPASYPEVDPARVHLTLLERGPHLLAPFHPRLRTYAERSLRRRGVDVRLGTAVDAVEADRILLRRPDGPAHTTSLPADLVVWATGVRVPGAVHAWGLPVGVRGRIAVDDRCRVLGHERVYAVGDVAADPERPLPQVATPALQQGAYVGDLVDRLERGRPTRPFRYTDRGSMAVIGRGAAVAEIRHLPRLTGPAAWMAWVGLHVWMLLGGRNRVATAVNLVVRQLTPSRNAIVGEPWGDGPGGAATAGPRASWAPTHGLAEDGGR